MEGLYGQFCTAVHNPTANPSHLWEPQAAHGTEKKVGRRGGGGITWRTRRRTVGSNGGGVLTGYQLANKESP